MKKSINILSGNVRGVLIALSLPMIGANFIQTAFGLTDMALVGMLGSQSVSAVGTASFYINLATAISTLVTVGVGVKYAQSLGAKQTKEADNVLKSGLLLTAILSLIYVIIVYVFARPLIGFFQISDNVVVHEAINYLKLSMFGMPFLFFSLTLTALLTSSGQTKSVFAANTTGLVVNIILDPLLIFGIIPGIPRMGIAGAAIATNISRVITLLMLLLSLKDNIFQRLDLKKAFLGIPAITRMGLPVAIQRVVFIFISMYLARIIARFGNEAIAAQKIGVQIESISYVTIGGLQGALAAFIGQNFGAKKYSRVKEGFNKAITLSCVFSLVITIVFLVFPEQLFSIFISEPNVIEVGIGYMRAIGISQLFMCVELITVGVFNGIGKTYVPPIISILFTALRIPLAIILTKFIGINGVWISISISSILKGLILYIWMKLILRKDDYNEEKLKYV